MTRPMQRERHVMPRCRVSIDGTTCSCNVSRSREVYVCDSRGSSGREDRVQFQIEVSVKLSIRKAYL